MNKPSPKALAHRCATLGLGLALVVGALSLFPGVAGASPATATLTLSGSPATSASGNSYVVALDASTDVAPTDPATVTDSGSNSCSSSSWTDAGPDGSGGELFTAGCNITAAESGGQSVSASYAGSDYGPLTSNSLTISAVPAQLTLTGSPVTSQAGNTFTVTLDAPTALTPTGTAAVTDSNANTCDSTNWADAGSDGSGGERYAATCTITAPETAGATAVANYAGPDYAASTSAPLTVGPAPASLSLQGTPAQSASGNSFSVVLDTPSAYPPSGTATVTDSNSFTCTSSSWTDSGSDGSGGELYSATCDITAAENSGVTVDASYTGSDYLATPTNTLTVGPASASLALVGTPGESPTGNDYSVMLDAPTDVSPTGTTTVIDNSGNSCVTSSWTDSGSDGSGGEIFAANCAISVPEYGGQTVSASYTGSDYTTSTSNTLSVAPGTATLTLSGTPVTSPNGNTYQVQIDTSVDLAPTNSATLTDTNVYSQHNSCTTGSWSDAGPDGSGGELFDASCSITESESGGTTVTASYSGPDYTTSASNTLTVGPGTGTLSLTGNSPVTSASGNNYVITADVSTDLAPGYGALVLDSESGGCSGSPWTDQGSDGSGGEIYTSSCAIPTAESGGATVFATYAGPDYTMSDSPNITVGSTSVGLSVSGTPTTSETGNAYTLTLDSPTDVTPTGSATVADSGANSCSSTSWSDAGTDGYGGELFTANCSITTPETAGMSVFPSYTGPDYSTNSTNEIFVEPADVVLALSGSPVQSDSGNAYTATIDAPSAYVPTGTATITDSGSNFCTATSWSDAGPDGAGGELYSATCAITSPETSGQTVSATYAGPDYNTSASNPLTVGAASATLSLAGSPVTSASGNSFIATIDSPSVVAPTGTATITDSATNSCTSSTWIDEGSDGSGGELFSASCSITESESGGATVSAAYSGSDYSTGASNTLNVSARTATLTLSGSPVPGTNNVYHLVLNSPTDVTPSGTITVTDSATNSCVASTWTDGGTNGTGGELFDASCTISASEAAAVTADATYAGSDYTATHSNTLSVGTPPAITGAFITGTATVGDTLSAYASGVTGTPTPVATYQWKANGVAIVGATASTYTPVASLTGATISVTITETNALNSAAATSAPTSAVIQNGPANAPAPTNTAATFGSPTSVTIASTGPTTLVVANANASFVITIPAGALPAGTTFSYYPVTDTAVLDAALPPGHALVLPFAITWQDGAGVAPNATAPITVAVTASFIKKGDSLYTLTTGSVAPVSAAITNGSATFSLTSDPVFAITAPIIKHATFNIGFKVGSATLSTKERAALSVIAAKLVVPGREVVTGYAKGNLHLARARALAVANYLKAHAKVSVAVHYTKAAGNKVALAAVIN